MARRVMILKDNASPLHFIRCAEPCEHTRPDQDWCDDGSGDLGCNGKPAKGYERGVCWLWSALHRETCESCARLCGWEVEG